MARFDRTGKTGQEVSIPVHPDLAALLAAAPQQNAVILAAMTNGTPWTESGFNSTFIKAVAKLARDGRIGLGLTFHGLRHTVGTLLVEGGVDIDSVRRWLGQKTLAMATTIPRRPIGRATCRRLSKPSTPLGAKSEQRCLTP
jgi:integrase